MFNTLRKRIKKELIDSIYKNKVYNEYKWNFIENKIVSWSRNYVWQIFGYFYIFFIVFLATSLIFGLLEHLKLIDLFKIFNGLLKFKDLIFNGQLTILAVIFPLVIGFVGVLIKDDIANKSLWKIYSRYSGFMLVGFSGLSLIALITISNYFEAFFSNELKIVASLIYSLWFLLNISLLAWLLHSTFNFINRNKQNEIIKKYTTNIVLEEEIRKRLYSLIPKVADKINLLPSSENENQKISFYFFEKSKSGLDIIPKNFKKKKYLLDINFTLISIALKLWKFRNSYFLIRKDMELYLPTSGSGYSYKDYDLALLKNCEFTLIEKLLIKEAYTFTNKNPFEDDDVENIVSSFFNNIDKAIKQDNQRLFDNEEETLQDFLQTIFIITSFTNDEGKVDNWLLLSDNTFFSNKLYYSLLREFYSLNKILVSKIDHSDYYFRNFCSFYPYSFIKNDEVLHYEIQKGLMELHTNLWINLLKENNIKEKPYLDGLYKRYIASWESWANKYGNIENKWEVISNYSNALSNHLTLSNSLVIESLKYKDIDASIWSVNIVNNWYYNNFSNNRNQIQYLWKKEILSTSFFVKEKNNELIDFILNSNEASLNDIVEVALDNIWNQSRIITASYIYNKDSNKLSELDRKIIFLLINGNKITPSDTRTFSYSFNKNYSTKILETYLLNLQPFYKITNNDIAHILIKKFNGVFEEEHISGRVYSGIGNEGISQIKECIIALIISNSRNIFNLSNNLFDFIFSDLASVNFRDSILYYLRELLNISDEIEHKVKVLLDKENISSLKTNYTTSINNIISTIQNRTEEEISNTPINEDRINEIKSYLSKNAFNKNDSSLPLKLFKEIKEVKRSSNLQKINLNGINKRDLIDTKEERFNDKNELYTDLITKQVYIKLFRDIFNKIDYIDKEFNFEEDLIVNILRDKDTIKNSIIFIGSNIIIEYLHRLAWDNNDNLPFRVKYENVVEEDYLCHISDIAVYSISNFNINYCLLLNLEIFKDVNIKRFENDYFVDLTFNENSDNRNNGSLKIKYLMEANFDNSYDSFKYIINKEEEL
ncbi:hypothetical protein CRU96_08385 [Malaciobacter halophilus]|nr:hypothetical protein [Malaciobacter halophilus]RYA23372.1 hypothetical protein CRU96_08385 [Malaciobacter halophilus]